VAPLVYPALPALPALSPRPLRFPLCQKRRDALFEIGAGVTQFDEIAVGALGKTTLGREATQHFLRGAERQWSIRRDLEGQVTGGALDVLRRHEAVHEAERMRFAGGHESSGEKQI